MFSPFLSSVCMYVQSFVFSFDFLSQLASEFLVNVVYEGPLMEFIHVGPDSRNRSEVHLHPGL